MSGRRLARDAAGGVAVAGVAAGLVGLRRLRRFYATLPPESGADEVLSAETADGWRLALSRYAATGPAKGVVVCGHGFAGSRLIFDLTPATSLARHLARAGYDVYTVDLRGRPGSRPLDGDLAGSQWTFDDFVYFDLPAAVAAACQRSGADGCFWLGLEMSGQALYAAVLSGTVPQVRGGVTFGAPVRTPASAHVPGVTTAPRMRRRGRVQFRAGAHLAGPLLALSRSKQLESSFRPVNAEPLTPARYLRYGVPDEATALADQFTDWITHDTMRSVGGATVWSDQLDRFTLPVLVMAAARDLQRPAAAARATFEALGSTDKEWFEAGVASGCSIDFGHDDLVAGTASPGEIFPRIVAWLDARAGDPTAAGAGSRARRKREARP